MIAFSTFRSRSALAALTAALSVCVCSSRVTAQEASPEEAELWKQIRAEREALIADRAQSFQPIQVNGQRLAPDAVRREAIYLIGPKQVEGKIADFFIQEYMEEAIAAGRDAKAFEIPEEQVTKDVQGVVAEFMQKNPGIEFWDAVRAQFNLSREAFLQQRRQTILFDRVFFPGPAKNWPVVTRESIMAAASGGDGKQFWENLEKASTDENGEPRELPAFWMHLCRGWVQKQLKKWSDIRYPSDGLASDVCLAVNGREWKTAEAFEMVKESLFSQDIERAMSEVVIREALKQELANAGVYLTDEQFRAEFDEYRKEYDDTPFTTEVIAVAFKGYPSLEAFRQRWRLIRSYESLIAKDINDDNLQAHANVFARFFSDGQTNVDVIQFLAKDVTTGAWSPNGHDAAKDRAEAALARIEKGESFDDVLASAGEFYQTEKEKGRLGSKSLNQLRQALRENEFSELLSGFSIGTYLFYDAEPGKVVGPLRGPDGWYLARVNSRSPARSKVDIAQERTRVLVKQDYINHRFNQWANEVMSKATVEIGN